jgi:hypothetical protein
MVQMVLSSNPSTAKKKKKKNITQLELWNILQTTCIVFYKRSGLTCGYGSNGRACPKPWVLVSGTAENKK